MRIWKTVLMVVLAATLTAYAVDCPPMVSAAQMMECCQTACMPSTSHAQDCCATMGQMHAPFVKASKVEAPAVSSAVLAAISTEPDFAFALPRVIAVADASHAPPLSSPITAVSPLRI